MSCGFWTAAVLMETLSAPALSKRLTSSHLRTPPPTVRGMNTCARPSSTTAQDQIALLKRGGRQGLHQHRRGPEPASSSPTPAGSLRRSVASWSRSTPNRRGLQRAPGFAGRCLLMGTSAGRNWTRSNGRVKCKSWARARSCLTSMDRDGTREGFDLALTRAVAEAVDVRSLPAVASASSIISPRACSRPRRRGSRCKHFFISANSPCARRRNTWQGAGIEIRL